MARGMSVAVKSQLVRHCVVIAECHACMDYM